jgi:hypothetical protein
VAPLAGVDFPPVVVDSGFAPGAPSRTSNLRRSTPPEKTNAVRNN